MARLRATWIPLRGHLPPTNRRASLRANVRNSQILLVILGSLATLGCGAATQKQHLGRIAELESYTLKLESQLTALKEQALERERSHCKSSGSKLAELGTPVAESATELAPSNLQAKVQPRSGAPADLPVVHLTPGGPPTKSRETAELTEPTVQGAEDQAESREDEADDATRPVLKIHGSQDGKVYHRPVTAADRQNTSSP